MHTVVVFVGFDHVGRVGSCGMTAGGRGADTLGGDTGVLGRVTLGGDGGIGRTTAFLMGTARKISDNLRSAAACGDWS